MVCYYFQDSGVVVTDSRLLLKIDPRMVHVPSSPEKHEKFDGH